MAYQSSSLAVLKKLSGAVEARSWLPRHSDRIFSRVRVPQSGGHFTRLESERDFSVGVCECAARGAAAAHARAPGPTPRAAPLVT